VYRTLLGAKIADPEAVSARIREAFVAHPNWKASDTSLRELRNQVTFALVSACDELEQVTPLVEEMFTMLAKSDRLA
jgi:type I restriction enzyme, R subunit